MTLLGDVDDLGRACQASGSGRSLAREKFLLKPPACGVGRDVMASSASLPCHGVPRVDGGRERWSETASALWPPSRSGCGLPGCGFRSFILMDIGRCVPILLLLSLTCAF